jgi:hypothetical protein
MKSFLKSYLLGENPLLFNIFLFCSPLTTDRKEQVLQVYTLTRLMHADKSTINLLTETVLDVTE